MIADFASSRTKGSLAGRLWHETFFLLFVCGASLTILCIYGNFELRDSEHIRVQAVAIAILPVVCAYLLLRNIGGRWFSSLFVLFALSLLAMGHHKKLALTGAPISWNDVATVKNFRIAISYLSMLDWLMVCGAVFVLGTLLAYDFSRHKYRRIAWLPVSFFLAAPMALICFYPYVANARLDRAVTSAGISYMSWDWPGNIKRNGLLLHLIQTSLRPVPAPPTAAELKKLAQLPMAPLPLESPQHVFYILCESCWNDTEHFADVFKPLENRGLLPLRAISPAYGGGTVNATFEMLTGLPVQGPLIGMVFQEYGRILSDNAQTVVSSMKEQGYKTIALHNYFGDFWQRNIVMPKLGFEQFVSLEQMHYEGNEKFPPDSLLFDKAISLLRQNLDNKVFFNLETVHMHGPYPSDGDFGEKNYGERLKVAVRDLDDFIRQVNELSKNSLIVIYGDHKPSLNRFFLRSGVIGISEFARTGATDDDFAFSADVDMKKLGDVPVLIGFVGTQKPAIDSLRAFLKYANHKPFYCLGAEISYYLLPTEDSASRFMVSQVCQQYDKDSYHGNRARVPSWLYSANLFDVDEFQP